MRRLILPLLAVAATAGCTDDRAGHYPSLLPRPIEKQGFDTPEAAPAPVATPDAALDARLAGYAATLDKSEATFRTAARNAEAMIAVARGLPEGSAPWLNAQTALAQLDVAREPVGIVQADLERLAIDRGTAGQPPYPAIDAMIERAETLAADQLKRSQALEAALAGR
jgi:hypothetical protein